MNTTVVVPQWVVPYHTKLLLSHRRKTLEGNKEHRLLCVDVVGALYMEEKLYLKRQFLKWTTILV